MRMSMMMVQVDEHKNAQGKYVQMSLLINGMDRQQIHHKYRATDRMKKSINMLFRLRLFPSFRIV